MTVPGGPLRFSSYSDVQDWSTEKAFVLPSTHFGHVANITHIEFVAKGTGTFQIDVRRILYSTIYFPSAMDAVSKLYIYIQW